MHKWCFLSLFSFSLGPIDRFATCATGTCNAARAANTNGTLSLSHASPWPDCVSRNWQLATYTMTNRLQSRWECEDTSGPLPFNLGASWSKSKRTSVCPVSLDVIEDARYSNCLDRFPLSLSSSPFRCQLNWALTALRLLLFSLVFRLHHLRSLSSLANLTAAPNVLSPWFLHLTHQWKSNSRERGRE